MSKSSFSVDSLSLTSTWQCDESRRVVSGPTTASGDRDVTVTLPAGATIQEAILHVTCGGTMGGSLINRVIVNETAFDLSADTTNDVDMAAVIGGNGIYTLTFQYRNAARQMAKGVHSWAMQYTSISLEIQYIPEGGESGEEDEKDVLVNRPFRTAAPDNAIILCDAVTRGILAVLHPETCTVTERAGGEYELTMAYPVDAHGIWRMLALERLIRAPVPRHDIPGVTVENPVIYQTTKATDLWEKIPSSYYKRNTTPAAYSASATYRNGNFVTYNDKVYRCIYISTISGITPGSANAANVWLYVAPVSSYSGSGSTTEDFGYTLVNVPGSKIETLAAGTSMARVGTLNNDYMRVRAADGKMGYIKIADCTEVEVQQGTIYEVEPRTVITQYFRIYTVVVNSYEHTVSVQARHISYDLDSMRLGQCNIVEASPQLAIAFMQSNYLGGDNVDERVIATDITEGEITSDWSYQSPISAICAPSTGIVDTLKARLYRDNDHIIIIHNNSDFSGVRIAYGTNLLGVTVKTDDSDLVTRIVPIAKDEEGNPLYLTEGYMDSSLVERYQRIRYEVIQMSDQEGKEIEKTDGTKETQTKPIIREKMRKECEKRFVDDRCDQPKVTIDIEFLLLGDSEEYRQYRNLQHINLYDIVKVYHPELGIDVNTQVTEYEWDAILRRYNRIELGDPFDYGGGTVPGYQIGTRAITARALSPGLRDKLGV